MKNLKMLVFVFFLSIISCSKNDNNNPASAEPVVVNVTKTSSLNFNYKIYFQEITNSKNRKGLIILAHGDGSSENDVLLNDQCNDLAKLGYVAVTTSYSLPDTGYFQDVAAFKNCMEEVVTKLNTEYAIPANKTIVGGLSRGGNLAYFMFLPANTATPTNVNLKGVVLMCAGADAYRGQNILKPAILMCNKIDSQVGITNAYDFKNALQNNQNPNVKTLSECLIFDNNNQDAHCSNAIEYKAFLIKKVQDWLP